MINIGTERRLREIAKGYKEFSGATWRVDGYGSEMTSVIIKKRPKIVSLYVGQSLQFEKPYKDSFDLYIIMAEMVDSLPEENFHIEQQKDINK